MNPALKETLLNLLGERLLLDPAECLAYGVDNSRIQGKPAGVALPESHEEVCKIVRACHQHGQAIVTRGRGTGTTGAASAINNELVISTENLNRILEIHPEDRYAIVQSGVSNQDLQNTLAEKGFFWPPDPTSSTVCSIGGNLAYNSAGPRALKYGTPRENTLGLTAVTGTGETLQCGARTTKSVVGYDLTRLMIGSEGTLGIITSAILKLTPLPESQSLLRMCYRDIESAAKAVAGIMAQAVAPATLEFIDPSALKLARQYQQLDLPDSCQAMLIAEVDGQINHLPDLIKNISQAAENEGCVEIRQADTPEDVTELWRARKALSPSLRKVAPKKINEDIVVPVSQIPQLIGKLQDISKTHGIPIVNFGHAGNGNIHVNLLYDPKNAQQSSHAERCLREVFMACLELGGSISGEHGIGISKKDFVDMEISPHSLQLMREIKKVFDPAGILNVGRTLPG